MLPTEDVSDKGYPGNAMSAGPAFGKRNGRLE